MNIVKVDNINNISLNNEEIKLVNNQKKLVINISGCVKIYETIVNEKNTMVINLLENSSLEYHKLNKDSVNTTLIINAENKSSIIYNNSMQINDFSDFNIISNVRGNDNNIIIKISSVLTKGELTIKADANVLNDTKGNEVSENIKVLNVNNSNCTVKPNLLVSSNEVLATHNTIITKIPDDYLLYLNSKGINILQAKELIINSYIKNNLNS